MAQAAGAQAQPKALFGARDVPQERFVLVAAPIGDGSRAQLNIYEQITDRRPCFASSGASPARVDPLLGSFDFTGICSRYLDANGYSVRVGGDDLATMYRLSVVRSGNDNLLLAAPTRNQTGPEMVVARTQGHDAGFLLFVPEPGWKLMRRHFGNRALGHLYLYRDSWPTAAASEGPPKMAAPAQGTVPKTDGLLKAEPKPKAQTVPVQALPVQAVPSSGVKPAAGATPPPLPKAP
jgi:hypothetical protein